MSIHTDRWNAVRALFADKIIPAFDMPNVEVMFEGNRITKDQLVIDDDGIRVKIDNCTFNIYDPDPTSDDGAWETKAETAARVRSSFKLYSAIPF